jgi:hypothetical protein
MPGQRETTKLPLANAEVDLEKMNQNRYGQSADTIHPEAYERPDLDADVEQADWKEG